MRQSAGRALQRVWLARFIVRTFIATCRELAAAGRAIVLVEQNLAATLAPAQRVYIVAVLGAIHSRIRRDFKLLRVTRRF